MIFWMIWLMNMQAGINLIHGGGGYAEMKALTIQARLPALLGALKEDLRVDPRYLAFTGESNRERLVLPSARLYDEDGRPLPFERIAVNVLEVSTGVARGVAERILRDLRFDESTVALPERKVHLLSLRRPGFAEAFLSMETESTVDITGAVLSALPCAPSFDRGLRSLEGLHLDGRTVVVTRAIWHCGDAHFVSRLLVGFDDERMSVKAVATKPTRCGAFL